MSTWSPSIRSVSRRGARGFLPLVVLAACSGGGSDTPVSDQICSELRSGMVPAQMYTPARQADYPDGEAFAGHLYGHAKIGCPDELATNEGLRGFLEAWGVNPDV